MLQAVSLLNCMYTCLGDSITLNMNFQWPATPNRNLLVAELPV